MGGRKNIMRKLMTQHHRRKELLTEARERRDEKLSDNIASFQLERLDDCDLIDLELTNKPTKEMVLALVQRVRETRNQLAEMEATEIEHFNDLEDQIHDLRNEVDVMQRANTENRSEWDETVAELANLTEVKRDTLVSNDNNVGEDFAERIRELNERAKVAS